MRIDFKIALILALAALPAGAALMVAPEYLHLSGIAVPLTFWGGIVLAVVLILIAAIIALRAEREAPKIIGRWGLKRMWPQYAMVIGGAIFFVGLIGFLQLNVTAPEASKVPERSGVKIGPEPNTDPNARGFQAFAFARLYDTPNLRRKYVFDFISATNARVSFYVSPSDLFVFSIYDVNNEPYSLEVPIASDAIPLNRYAFLYWEVALEGKTTRLRILVDGKQVAERIFGVRIELGKDYWKWKHSSFGADINGQNNAPFKLAFTGSGHVPLSDVQIMQVKQRFDTFLVQSGSPLQYR